MSAVDGDNPVVRLCAEGMRAEAEGRPQDARALFLQAWELSRDDYEACIAAHYVARHQDSSRDALHWNQTAFDRARAVGDERVLGFQASLLLNLGKSHEDLGAFTEARALYERAFRALDAVPESPYRDIVQGGITRGLERVAIALADT
ncbi:hypothetical protein [Melittangium boletus]|uniref:Tetratricopeptide repeat protein n=1 Tax=Melittangium boletus DSM 14713 TaxID=1294270 RepID=A0A250IUF9_9BACT|nr:hypothetical protein [Melittangium boletus]ATB34566.1 hypothetical protein MEBOL_008071 [Melittangium boletus DSM 14713]